MICLSSYEYLEPNKLSTLSSALLKHCMERSLVTNNLQMKNLHINKMVFFYKLMKIGKEENKAIYST